MKYLPLIWAGIWRKRTRTAFTVLSVMTAFLLFGMLQGVNSAFTQSVRSANINRLYVAGGLTSFRSIVETENYGHAFANFVPGLLEHTDLPDITAQSQARKIVLGGMLDGAGRRLPADEVRKLYEKTRNLEVLDQATWTVESLIRAATV